MFHSLSKDAEELRWLLIRVSCRASVASLQVVRLCSLSMFGSSSSGLHPAVPLPFKTPASFHLRSSACRVRQLFVTTTIYRRVWRVRQECRGGRRISRVDVSVLVKGLWLPVGKCQTG
ncbi:hypothetical protein DPX16_4073 [Anabarilius grahami]|uniref:Uncharacterized protein n=1 Tax=Anabarilius grahami TaxID=495550 RepID=A0A3N0Y009_ANAGA|nr:hypothetical protein DPX16_4073 [Anabarilius grahami]